MEEQLHMHCWTSSWPAWQCMRDKPGAGDRLGVKGSGEQGSVGWGAQQDPHAGHEVLHGVQLPGAPHHLCQHGQAVAVQGLRLSSISA